MRVLGKAKIVPLFYLIYCNWWPSELGHSALFGILDIGALRIDDLDYGGTMNRNILGVQCLGNEFSSYLGHTSDGCCSSYALLTLWYINFTLLHGTECFYFSTSFLLLSFGWARRHGFWNQVVKAAFRLLNSVISGTFCRSPARSKSPNASVRFLNHIEVHLFLLFCLISYAKMSMQPPNGEAASPKKQSPSRSPSGSRSPDVKWFCSSYLLIRCTLMLSITNVSDLTIIQSELAGETWIK